MEATYRTSAIILAREHYRENDSRITAYSLEQGKLELVARGAKKILSKLSGHIEPASLVEIMVVKGRQYDYAGSAIIRKSYANTKGGLEKLSAVGIAFKAFDKAVKPGVADSRLFFLLEELLEFLEKFDKAADYSLCAHYFIYKMMAELGLRPNLKACAGCGHELEPDGNRFSPADGGVICRQCAAKPLPAGLRPEISADAIKIMRLLDSRPFIELAKIKTDKKLESELIRIINHYYRHFY